MELAKAAVLAKLARRGAERSPRRLVVYVDPVPAESEPVRQRLASDRIPPDVLVQLDPRAQR